MRAFMRDLVLGPQRRSTPAATERLDAAYAKLDEETSTLTRDVNSVGHRADPIGVMIKNIRRVHNR